jgi:hypothetical protein
MHYEGFSLHIPTEAGSDKKLRIMDSARFYVRILKTVNEPESDCFAWRAEVGLSSQILAAERTLGNAL